MKPKHIFILVIVLAILALIAAVANAFGKSNETVSPGPGSTPSGGSTGGSGSSGSGSSSGSTVTLDYDRSLFMGSKGAEVVELQKMFNASPGTPKLSTDGQFGAKTLNAVIKVMGFGTTYTTLRKFQAGLGTYGKDMSSTTTTSGTGSGSWYDSWLTSFAFK